MSCWSYLSPSQNQHARFNKEMDISNVSNCKEALVSYSPVALAPLWPPYSPWSGTCTQGPRNLPRVRSDSLTIVSASDVYVCAQLFAWGSAYGPSAPSKRANWIRGPLKRGYALCTGAGGEASQGARGRDRRRTAMRVARRDISLVTYTTRTGFTSRPWRRKYLAGTQKKLMLGTPSPV